MPPEPPRSLCLRHSTCAPAARTVHVRQLNHCIRYFQMPPKTLLTMALISLIVKTFDRDDQTDSKIHQPCAYLQKWRHTQCALLFRVLWDTCGDFVYISNKCFFCLKNKLKKPNRPHTSNNCSELRKSYKQHGYLDKNNSRHTVNFFPFSRHTVNFWTFHATRLTPLRPSYVVYCFREPIKTFFFDACEMTVKSRVLHLFPIPHPEEAILACKLQILVFFHRFMARTLSRGP